MSLYFCCDDDRRNAVLLHPTLNGIDFVEVLDDDSMPMADRQRILEVTLLKLPAAPLNADNLRIDGGEAVRGIRITGVTASGSVLRVEVDRPGDFTPYTLRLVANAVSDDPPPGYDLLLSAVDFSFKVNCETEFDCADEDTCAPEVYTEPALNYLARDFNSIRKLMLDRIHVVAPDWHEDHLADFMQAMIDLKAYVSDYQNYQLDAINTEAYLFTSRSRVSVRRHARLVDYRMHDGCAPRVWAQIQIDPAVVSAVVVLAGTTLLTRAPGLPVTLQPDTPKYRAALETNPEFFDTLHDLTGYSAHNEMCFYTWGASQCVLPRGATRATLAGEYPNLQPGDVLIFEEVRGPVTGDPADADPGHRFAVRLTGVSPSEDPLFGQKVTEIEWHPDDALPAPLCLSSNAPPSDEATDWPCPQAISVARGNIVLAQHGRWMPIEALGAVPENSLFYAPTTQARCEPGKPDAVPLRFRPRLGFQPVAQVVEYQHDEALTASASRMTQLDPASALPCVELGEDDQFDSGTLLWTPQRDLLDARPDDRHFVLEVENDGTGRLRFGDGIQGRRPEAGDMFFARYAIGDGLAGNIGFDALGHVVTTSVSVVGVRNPLPAEGGQGPEGIETVRQNAPNAFRTQERAVTPADYEAVALRYPDVQRAAATFRWTGSWYTVFLTVDRAGGKPVDEDFERDFRAHINRYRMMGYDIEVDAPHYVPIDLRLEVCAAPDYFRTDVEQALLEVFSDRLLPDGTKGFFHPDNFTFGQPLYLSQVYATAATVEGVQSVEITRFQAQDQPARSGLSTGQLELGRLEIAQLENDPSFPKRGVFTLIMKGGK